MADFRVNPLVAKAGEYWTGKRKEVPGRTQGDISRESARQFGERGKLNVQQISRLERGSMGKATLDDAIILGRIYGLTPNDVAALYGLWPEGALGEPPPQVLLEAINLARVLPDDLRERFLETISTDTTYFLGLKRLRDEEPGKRRRPTEPPAEAVAASK